MEVLSVGVVAAVAVTNIGIFVVFVVVINVIFVKHVLVKRGVKCCA